jgi:hypothetical protein
LAALFFRPGPSRLGTVAEIFYVFFCKEILLPVILSYVMYIILLGPPLDYLALAIAHLGHFIGCLKIVHPYTPGPGWAGSVLWPRLYQPYPARRNRYNKGITVLYDLHKI